MPSISPPSRDGAKVISKDRRLLLTAIGLPQKIRLPNTGTVTALCLWGAGGDPAPRQMK